MFIFPAINLQNGSCVRLSRGHFDSATVYDEDPIRQALRFEEAGAKWLHIVDLDGAKIEEIQQLKVIESIARASKLRLQIGGGIRQESDIQSLLSAGADRVVIGSLAVQNPTQVGNWITHVGRDKIVLAMDVRLSSAGIPEVLTKGWQHGSALSLWDVLTAYKGSGLKTILCTDSQRDGMLTGANHELYSKIRQMWSELQVIASGGVSDMRDLQALANLELYGAIVGTALYEGKIDAAEAFSTYQT